MKKGMVLEGIVEKTEFPNKGIVFCEGEKVIIKNGLEGQKIRFSVTKKRKGKAEGRLLEVLERSPLEQDSSCPHFAECGGCTYQTLPYEEQLRLKERQVKELLDSVCETPYEFQGIKKSPEQFGYRNKMEYSFGDACKDGPLTLGLHKRGSFYDILTTDECCIVEEDFRKILSFTLEFARTCGLLFYHKLTHQGYFRHLLVRKGKNTGEMLVDLITSTQASPDLTPWKEGILNLPLKGQVTGILHTSNDSLADVIANDGTELLYGRDFFQERILGLDFRISPFSFFQTNSLGAEVLYETARSFIGDTRDKVIFDLYSGTGTIAQILAPVAEKVVGIEIVPEAVEAARQNAQANRLDNCTFLAGDVLKVLDTVEEKPDLIVLDPPRDGIHPKALTKIMKYGVERLVYISCKPTSLVRDLEALQAGGYRLEKACAVDMFPGTGHVETVVLLSKGEIDSKKVRVEFSLEDMDMSGFQKGATYEQIKAYVLKHTGLKVSSLYISQVKRKCGLDVGQNYNLSKKEDAKVPQCPPEKEAAIMDALKHFQMLE